MATTHDPPSTARDASAPDAVPRRKAGRWKRWRHRCWNALAVMSLAAFVVIGLLQCRSEDSRDEFVFSGNAYAGGANFIPSALEFWVQVFERDQDLLAELDTSSSFVASWTGIYRYPTHQIQLFPTIEYNGSATLSYRNQTLQPRSGFLIPTIPIVYKLGFGYQSVEYAKVFRGWRFVVPNWFFLCLFAAIPTARLIAFVRRRRRHNDGATPCPACGYDLRGNPAATACPECGATTIA